MVRADGDKPPGLSPSVNHGQAPSPGKEVLMPPLDSLAPLYVPDERDAAIFGDHYAPPLVFEHAKWHEVAKYGKEPGGDGQDVWVHEARWPAQFYMVVALPGTDSVGDFKPGYTLKTGAGHEAAEWAALTAKLISQGMIGLYP